MMRGSYNVKYSEKDGSNMILTIVNIQIFLAMNYYGFTKSEMNPHEDFKIEI